MKLAIVDDELHMLEQTSALVKAYGEAGGLVMDCSCYQTVEDFIRSLEEDRYVIVFMDIHFAGQEENGIDAARRLRRVDPECILIFLTDNEGFMPEAFSVHAFSYVLKGKVEEMIGPVLDDAIRLLPDSKVLSFTADRRTVQLFHKDIMYAVTDAHYIILTDVRGDNWRTRMTFSEIQEKLCQEDGFLAINKGIIVNMLHIDAIQKRDCIMNNGTILPVRGRDSSGIAQTWHNYMFDSIRREQRGGRK